MILRSGKCLTIGNLFVLHLRGMTERAVWLADRVEEEKRERPFLQGSEQVLRSRPRSASQPPVQFVPCPHVFPFSPAGFVNWAQLGWEKQRKVTVVIKGNRSVLVLPVLWLIPGWQKRNG